MYFYVGTVFTKDKKGGGNRRWKKVVYLENRTNVLKYIDLLQIVL